MSKYAFAFIFLTMFIFSANAEWKSYSMNVHLEPALGSQKVAYPLPLANDTSYQRVRSISVQGSFTKYTIQKDPVYGTQTLIADFTGQKTPAIDVEMVVETQNRSKPEETSAKEDVSVYLKPTMHVPLDGIVKKTADKIVKGIHSPEKKAQAIFNWIVDNTFRDPKIKGCGLGDVASMLESGNLGGKCADLSSLFVGLTRAAGVPAREVFGIRVGDSALYKSIGKSGDISKAQHCRAEFYVKGKGWIAVDPADVRKVVLEEKLELNSPQVKELRKKFFGFWEMNWVAFNSSRDFELPGSEKKINYLMYPISLDVSGVDSMDPDSFKYKIQSKVL